MYFNDFVKSINERDMSIFSNDFENRKNDCFKEGNDNVKLIADFTEYSPLHNGHFHCMNVAKSQFPDALFVAIVPGLFERSGRGLPYILPREVRAEIAISVGADIVVEGPPMGIMGSGQYSLALSKMFKALNTDIIPRGYNPVDGFDKILERISLGHGIAPKPYKIVDMETKEVLLKDKLAEDNYVIVSFSKSLRKIGFDFKDKFLFVERISGVSGSKIRESVSNNDFELVRDMMPAETIEILKREIDGNRAPLHDLRYDERIIDNANNLSFEQLSNLNLFNDNLAQKILDNRPFNSIDEIYDILDQGFSRFFKTRILSVLEANVSKEDISSYIDYYPSVIRVLGYKNEDVLQKFKEKINHKNVVLANF
ncbi:MAG: nucleotidyltransferase family protein [Methanobrevibacter sp.]|nr:nucleotidyltransferase family protein [Methanobrevibacter sp.]